MEGTKLKEAFTLFSNKVEKLDKSYRNLQRKFAKLYDKCEESHHTLENLATHMSDGLIFVTQEGNISLFNPSAERLTGYQAKHVLEQAYSNCFLDTFFGGSMKKALREENNHRVFLTLNLRKQTRKIEVSSSTIPQKGIALFLRVLTEIRHLEEAVARNDRLKALGEMAAQLAHEIRNPLGGIEGFASLLSRELKNTPHLYKMIQAILRGTQTLNQLVTSVLDYTRPLKLHFAPTSIPDLIQEVCTLVLAEKKQTISCSFSSKLTSLKISADAMRIKTVLFNIIHNAIEASSKNIFISLEKKHHHAIISIVDKGEGIALKNHEKIFYPFFTTKLQGTGLGLCEAYKIIQAHGGTISVHSKEGKGSTFFIKIPIR